MLTTNDFGTESQKLKYLKTYLNEDKPVDESIAKKFPITSFGSEEDELRIIGVKSLLDMFESLDSEKYDFTEKYGNVNFVEVQEPRRIVLDFPQQDLGGITHSIYDFYSNFLDQFRITKFTDYCLRSDFLDIIDNNMAKLLTRNADCEKQFRLLRDKDGTWGIRALTSDVYKNYDNGVVLYLSLLAIHKYASLKNTKFRINNAFISDSFMHVFFERPDPIIIPNVGKVFLGVSISNGEIRNYKFKAELRYRIVDTSNNKSLAAIHNNPIFSIVHSMSVETIDEQIKTFYHLDEYETGIIEFIKKICDVKTLSEDSVYYLINHLISTIKECSDISKKTKEEFKKLETEHLIGNTLSLIDFFDKAKTIKTDMDEVVFVERIYHKVIADFLDRRRN